MNPPVFPEAILLPFVPMPAEPAASNPISSPMDRLDVALEYEATLSPQPAQKGKKTSVAKKGKAKKASSSKKGKEKMPMLAAKIEEDSDFEATPSLPPAKKRKTASAAKKGKTRMTAAEISH